jgi:SIR2-like domain
VKHDPVLHSNYLRQCLSQEKRRLALFIGAGCPMAVRVNVDGQNKPLIPDIAGMTSEVCAAIASTCRNALLDLIKAQIKVDSGIEPTIESLLSHIRALRQVAGGDEVRGCKGKDLDALDTEICNLVAGLADRELPNRGTAFHKLAVWVGAISRSCPVELFTTNYDLLMEQALEENRVPYFDGFVGTRKTFFDLQAMEDDHLPERWARLWKIHGSLNWFEDEDGSIHRGDVKGQRRVIYPSHLKYDESRRMPYLAMIDRLRAFLKQPTAALVISGYSFNDKHLNEVIVQGLQGNATAVAFGLLHGPLRNYKAPVDLALSRSNLNLFASDEAVIGTKRSDWTTGREANSCPRDTIPVTWIDDPTRKGFKNAAFTLGDFASFGSFLEELIGEKERAVAN